MTLRNIIVCSFLILALIKPGTVFADFTLISDPSTITSPGGSFDFNFNGQQAAIGQVNNLIGIRVDYRFYLPVVPGTSTFALGAKLLDSSDGGSDHKLGFDIETMLADGVVDSYSDHGTSSPSGFVFSEPMKSTLLPAGHITGLLQASGAQLEALNQYFGFFSDQSPAGFVPGSISAFMTLRFTGAPSSVPEPCSIITWIMAGAVISKMGRRKKIRISKEV